MLVYGDDVWAYTREPGYVSPLKAPCEQVWMRELGDDEPPQPDYLDAQHIFS